ncbi:flagellar assembly protein FliW [Dissulfurirhabdus thermomarina]|uniref:Flagellar assembly factor FliW n=1 Tax=Dissulfurirhabdus thermomarina TaxID=1765737 RepID=A0A6N9TLV9_DISTH|nr:flagellar assembly protein FliW [Dissulfurirhabdus thermomarina]NDY42271.1 flagellar assembly protein FliW [Dissulfurirhabdus thermomarina]NMX22776.1 flagellar assembly protein FliW [Dissulfurirhabdus thermomarina]
MEIATTRFGRIEIKEEKMIRMTQGILGFPDERRYVLLPHREGSSFFWLQSVDRPELAFVVISPFLFAPDYSFDIPDAVERELEIERREQVDVLVLVTIPAGNPRAMTANLLGPLVINVERRLGRQLVLDPNRYPLQHPLIPDAAPSPGEPAAAGEGHKAAGAG